MSIPISIIHCTGCSKEWPTHRFWGLHYYLLKDEKTVHVCKKVGWCGSCCELRLIEEIPDEKDLFEKFITAYDKFQKYDLTFKKTFLGGLALSNSNQLEDYNLYRKKLGEARAAIEWRRKRISKPKCLACSSDNILYMDIFSEREIHPDCGGTLITKQTDICFSVRRSKKIYEMDGSFIREEEG